MSTTQNETETVLSLAQIALDDMKGVDIVTIPLQGKTSMADYLVIATGTSDKHAESLARNVLDKLNAHGFHVQGIEGSAQSQWVLVDAGDVIVHVFTEDAREHYGLEKMWAHDFEESNELNA